MLKSAIERLKATSDTPTQDAKILLCHVLDCQSATDLILREDKALTASQQTQFTQMLDQRLQHRPIAQIIGYRWFYGRKFTVTSDVLDPRPETELLIEQALHHAPEARAVLDLGTGSGCLLATYLLENPQAHGVGVDICEKALAVAHANIDRHNLADRCTLTRSDWTTDVSGRFDIVLCNPPYIPETDKQTLASDVLQWEPHGALFGGETGLDVYVHLARVLSAHLQPATGQAFLEVGIGQAKAVTDIFAMQNFQANSVPDYAGKPRCIHVKAPHSKKL